MRRNLIITILLLFVVASIATAAGLGPTSVKIDAAKAKQGAVTFPHDKHVKAIACDKCHHTDKGLKEASDKVKKCSACHLDPKDKAPSMRDASLTKNPFHTLCVNCHKAGKKGPTMCNKCHVK